jgi:hypothetical protein
MADLRTFEIQGAVARGHSDKQQPEVNGSPLGRPYSGAQIDRGRADARWHALFPSFFRTIPSAPSLPDRVAFAIQSSIAN